MLRVLLTRDSVAAGDDFEGRHAKRIQVQQQPTALNLVATIQQDYLPKIATGKATWVVSSSEPFAVCAQQWTTPRAIGMGKGLDALLNGGNELRLHFSYLAQADPDLVLDILSQCTFRADSVG